MRVLSRSTKTSVALVAAVIATTIAVAAPSEGAERSTGKTGADAFQLGAVQPTRDGATISGQISAAKAAARGDGRTSVIFKLKADSLASYTGGVPGLRPTSPSATGARRLDVGSPASRAYLGYLNRRMAGFEAQARQISPRSTVTRRLDVVVGGVAMTLPADDVARLTRLPQVEAVFVDTLEQLQTDATPQFIGATSAWGSLGGQSDAGEGTIVGVLDSGIWPEHPSLSDPDPAGEAYPAPRPSTNGSPRQCDFSGGSNPGPAFSCNNKLIGAFTFLDTYRALVGLDPAEYTSARDDDGHGTHTATTAAGNGRVEASVFGVPRGQVSGIAPRAHVIAYRVCAAQGCFSSDSAAAVQRAIVDGVDVINFSISGGSNPYGDAVSLAFLDAYNAGVFVAASAGNSGPGANTTDHREPWVTTVAASTGPRSFVGSATLSATGGASLTVRGATIAPPLTTPSPVVNAATAPFNDPLCLNGTTDSAFAGKVVLCKRGGNGRVAKGYNVLQRGAVGMILYNQSTAVTDLETDNHFLPTVHVQVAEGNAVAAFLATHPSASATIATGSPTPTPGDVMASFSSRGGDSQSLGISKPDVTAPGVQILAGNTPTPADPAVVPGELFQAIAGTSMSSPHVAGAAALLKDLHPSWTPGQVHSALMTTASTKTVKEDGTTPTDAFDDGSGRIDLSRAGDPFFTIDESGASFVSKEDTLQTTNYPSIYVPALAGKLSLTRTLSSVSNLSRSYSVSAKSGSSDFKVTVSPSSFTLAPGASRTLTVTADGKDVALGQTRFATVTLKSDGRTFTIPVTIVRRQGPVAVTKTCAPDPVAVGSTATCTVTMTNNTSTSSTVSLRDKQPAKLRLLRDSVVGGTAIDNVVTATTTLPARQSPAVDASYAAGSSPAGYLPLSLFGIAPIAGVGDETITNFNVPAFTLAGVTYTRVGVVSNGYVVLGGGTGSDVQFVNTDLPDASPPNNIIAPFWTDLNPGAAGSLRIGTLTDGVNTWVVVDYQDVREYSTTAAHSFQVWIGVNGTEDVTATYGPSSGNGDGGFATVGAENPDGTQGRALYVDGSGRLPVQGDEIRVTGTPGSVSSATVTFSVQAKATGTYVNYAEVTGDSITGTAIARFAGTIVTSG